jgi:hypothetical protein
MKMTQQQNLQNDNDFYNWTDDNVIDFVNWYIKVHNLDDRYTLENRTLIESFKNGDNAEKWNCK